MTNAELQAELVQQQAENQALRAQVAAFGTESVVAETPDFTLTALLSYLLAETHTGVMLADADSRVQWVNASFTALTGLAAAAVLGQRPATFLRQHLREDTLGAYIEKHLCQQRPFAYELPQPAGAAVRWLRMSVRPIPA